MTSKAKIPWLLSKYSLAWTNHDVELIQKIFHKDAIYQINGKVQLKGISAIIKYWEDNKAEQEKVNFSVARIMKKKN